MGILSGYMAQPLHIQGAETTLSRTKCRWRDRVSLGQKSGHITCTITVRLPPSSLLPSNLTIPATVRRRSKLTIGDNGVGPNGYAPVLFQSLATKSAIDPSTGHRCTSASSTDACVLPFLGLDRRVASVVLLADGASFFLMTVLFTTLGSAADYGNASSAILFGATVLCWCAQVGFLFVGEREWRTAMALYIGGMVSYGVTLVFYASVFPRLARNTPATKIARQKVKVVEGCGGDGFEAEKDAVEAEALERARLSSHSTAHSNWGYLIVLLLSLTLLLPSSTKHLPRIEVYVLALTVGYWFLLALPWFTVQKPRPGPALPKGASWLTIGWKQIAAAVAQRKSLPYTFAYLAGFFLLADGINTTGALIRVLQARQTHFSFLSITLLNLSQAFFSILSCYVFLYLQRRHQLPSKRMLLITNLVSVLIPAWGLLGLRSESSIGFKNNWEFWAYNIVFGLGQAPYYAYSQAVMADLTPPGEEGMWFGLFGLTNRASSLIGPNVCAAIIERTGNDWAPFAFLAPVTLAATLVIGLGVDVDRGHGDAVDFAASRGRKGPETEGYRPLEPNDAVVA